MKDKTAIDAVIGHSRAIFIYKIFLQGMYKFKYLLSRTPDVLPSGEDIKNDLEELKDQTQRRIKERQEVCKKYLLQLFKGETYGFKDNFYLSSTNLQDGYVLLYKNVSDELPSKVLFLSDSKKNKKGDIAEFEKCKSDLLDLESNLKPSDRILHNHFQ